MRGTQDKWTSFKIANVGICRQDRFLYTSTGVVVVVVVMF